MAAIRKPLQGITNILRFNWHFYLLSFILIIVLFVIGAIFHLAVSRWIAVLIILQVVISLFVSMYVYDLSGFYKLGWLNTIISPGQHKLVNINAGFDEISELLQQKFPGNALMVFDFYDPLLHTEVSIKRARNAYPSYPGTISTTTSAMSINEPADKILLIFAAHEIRDIHERIGFFNVLRRNLNNGGEIILVEHLQDMPNFLAYNIGFLHFVSRKAWYDLFEATDFIVTENKINPFITMFRLKTNGN